ncbi:MAG TPA: extracellular solute-binding protein [Micropepsaceae bacterium]|nr:extracellular solute-binding protein [Micropepsaceae bacterium]
MAMLHLDRRQFSTLAVLALASPRAMAAAPDPFDYQGPDRQKFLADGARREGRLMLYSSLIPNLGLKAIVDGFHKKYSFVDIQSWRGTEGNIAQKTLAELRAGPPVGDLLEGSELAPLFIKSGFLQKFHSPEIAKTPAQYRDATGLTAATRFSYYGTAYNTKLVPPGTQPKTFTDLLDTKWKNRLAWRVGSDSGAHMFVANLMLTMGEADCDSYLKKLATQNVVGFPGSAQALIDRVIAGEYAVTLTTAQHLPVIAAAKGAPIAAQVLQPMPSTVASIMIPKGTTHPHAAMLFVDYVLSSEGQSVLAQAQYFPVNQEVQPLTLLQPVSPRLAGLKENFIDDETLYATHGKVAALLKKHFP